MSNTAFTPRRRWVAAAALLTLGLAWSTGTATAGDDDQRIQFAPGTDSGSVSGTFSEGEVDNFVLRASAGQTMFVSVTPAEAGASVAVRDPSGAQIAEPPEPGTDFSVVLPSTGDYVISVGPGRSEVASYTLNVRIPPASPTPPPPSGGAQRVQFARGTDSATVSGSIAPGTTVSYVLRAAAGQTMNVSLGPDGFAALTTIFAPNGDVVGAGHTTATASLPVAGDYIVEIGNTGGSTNDFTMTVRIPAGSPGPAPAPGGAQRIQFAPGADHGTVQGTFREGQSDRYVLRASAGQEMTLVIDPPGTGASLGVFAPDGSQLPGGPGDVITYRLPATGDYTIVIGGGRGDSSPSYTLQVIIPPTPRRIEFAQGTNQASLEDSVGITVKTYVLRARAGQTMAVQLDAADDNAMFSVNAPDGSFLAGSQTGATMVLPSTGDYTVMVFAAQASPGTTYRISFWIV
jgi:hypothetical protein